MVLTDVWLPAVIAGKITEELFLEQLPDVDIDEELKRKEKREKSELESLKHEMDDMKADRLEKDLLGEGKKNALHGD